MVEELKGYRCPYCGAILNESQDNEKFECNFCQNISFRVDNKTNIRLINALENIKLYKFEDADEIYEDLADESIDNNLKVYVMAEWGRLLSNFGVVYINDFNNKVSIPTFSEYNPDVKSILDCDYYQNIMNSNINSSLKKELEIKAKELDKVYKKIEKDLKDKDYYDVFICTKISLRTKKYPDIEGYTRDYKLANEIYDELIRRGYKVFYSEKCCRGIEYDSQILSALVKSKKMIVIATCKDYLESPWVQSEWRRWINFIDCEDQDGNPLKERNSIILCLPNYEVNSFDLPRIIRKKKIQYFTSQLSLLNLFKEVKKEAKKNIETIPIQEKKDNNKEITKNEKQYNIKSSVDMFLEEKKKEKKNNKTNNPKTLFEEHLEKANKGDLDSIKFIADCYYNGKEGKDKDYKEAVKWYKKASEKGDADAQNRLGNRYYNGEGVTKDYLEAVKWYTKAAEQGHMYAQCNLGNCYYNGRGVLKNYSEAAKWYIRSAGQGNDVAQCNLGNCYYNGRGVPQDYKEAVKWYQKAAGQGNASAKEALTRLRQLPQEVVSVNNNYSAVANNTGIKAVATKKPSKISHYNAKDKFILALICLFLGGLGIHNFMMGETKKGVVKIVASYFGGIGIILGILDFVKIIKGTYKVNKNAFL